MNDQDKQPSAPTRCSHDGKVERKKPVRSEATRHSHGPCPMCDGKGYYTGPYWDWRLVECNVCKGTGRAND